MIEANALLEMGRKFRLVTRSDMDGLVCAVILRRLGLIDEVTFAHPKDMQDGIIEITENDITTNLPYNEAAFLVFDHHASEVTRLSGGELSNYVVDANAPSAARIVYDFFVKTGKLDGLSESMMLAVDKADSGSYTKEDVLNPQGWELLSFVMDARTGLGRFRDFNISNYQLMMKLIDFCSDHGDAEDILEIPDVKERVDLYFKHQQRFREQIEKCTRVDGGVAIIDLREEEIIWAGNRFMVYAMFPSVNISCHVIWGKNRKNTVFAVGKSIFNRTSIVNVGKLMLEYGGGGHEAAGTCQVDNIKSEECLQEIVSKLK